MIVLPQLQMSSSKDDCRQGGQGPRWSGSAQKWMPQPSRLLHVCVRKNPTMRYFMVRDANTMRKILTRSHVCHPSTSSCSSIFASRAAPAPLPLLLFSFAFFSAKLALASGQQTLAQACLPQCLIPAHLISQSVSARPASMLARLTEHCT